MQKNLHILVDIDSCRSGYVDRLLAYASNEHFDISRISKNPEKSDLQIKIGHGRENSSLKLKTSSRAFFHTHEDILDLSQHLGVDYWDLVFVYILDNFNLSEEEECILVTENLNILTLIETQAKRLKIIRNSILKPVDACLYTDLYLKKNGKYYAHPNMTFNKGLWYLHSMKQKAKEYQNVWSIVVFGEKKLPQGGEFFSSTQSLGDRLIDMLIALDEIGFNFFSNVNNDTQDSMVYHFNYWIMLFTGVLDALARIAKIRFGINKLHPNMIGLGRDINKKFIHELSQKNPAIGDLLSSESSLIQLMHLPRDIVIHRDRLNGIQISDASKGVHHNMVTIPYEFAAQIRQYALELKLNTEDLGLYNYGKAYYLEPYSFCRVTTSRLYRFVNLFLPLLSFDELKSKFNVQIRDNNQASTGFQMAQKLFENSKLGY